MINRGLHKTQRWLLLTLFASTPAPISSKCRFDPQVTRQVFNIPISLPMSRWTLSFRDGTLGSSTQAPIQLLLIKMFVALFWNCLLCQLWGARDKSIPLAICCLWPKMVLPSLSCKMAWHIQLAGFGNYFRIFVQTQTYCQKTKICWYWIFQNACHVSEGNFLRGDQNHFEQGHISVERTEIPGRDAFKR